MKNYEKISSDLPYTLSFSAPPFKVLIIDDEADIYYLLGSILKQKNILPYFAGSISEASRLLADSIKPAVIFLDNHLPDGMGISYIRTLKKQFPDSKIIMITSHDTSYDREKALAEGADSFIGKPFSKEVVLKTLENFSQGGAIL